MIDAQFHRCQRIYPENVEFIIEYKIYSLARRIYSGHMQKLYYLCLIGSKTIELSGLTGNHPFC